MNFLSLWVLCMQLKVLLQDNVWLSLNPLDPTEISENPSQILGKSPFLTKYGSICFFHNNLFNIEYLSLQVMFILINIELPTKWYRTPLCMLQNVNVNTCQYPDVSIGDRSDFNLNFSSELRKIVRHLSPRFPLLEVFGRPRICTAGSVWKT